MTRTARPGGKPALFEVLSGGRGGDSPAPAAAPTPAPRASAAGPSFGGRVNVSVGVVGGLAVTGALAVALGGAFYAGRLTAPAGGSLADQRDVRPDVLDVGTSPAIVPVDDATTNARLASTATASVAIPPSLGPRDSQPVLAPTIAAPSAVLADTPVDRVGGLNYLLVQSYHPSEREGAELCAAALREAGIGATVESGIRGWGSYLCVVGTDSFRRRTRNPEFDAYKARVMAVGDVASRDRKIKKFDPQLVQWGR